MCHRCHNVSAVSACRWAAMCAAVLAWSFAFCICAPTSALANDAGSSILEADLSNLKFAEADRAALLRPVPVISKQVPHYIDSPTFDVHIDGQGFKLPKGVRIVRVFAESEKATPSINVNVTADGFAQERLFKKSKRVDEFTPLKQDQIDLYIFDEIWRIPSSLESLTATWKPKVPYSTFGFAGMWGNDAKHLGLLVFIHYSLYKSALPNGPDWWTSGVEAGLRQCGYSDAQVEDFTRAALKNLHSLKDEDFDRRWFAVNGDSLKSTKQPVAAAEDGILLVLKASLRTWTKAFEISTDDGDIYVLPMKSDRSALGRYIAEGFDRRGGVRWSMDFHDKSTLINNEDGAIESVCRVLGLTPTHSAAIK